MMSVSAAVSVLLAGCYTKVKRGPPSIVGSCLIHTRIPSETGSETPPIKLKTR